MKILLATITLSASAIAAAQQAAPSPNPPRGGMLNPGTLVTSSAVTTERRQLLRNAAEHQYTYDEIEEYRQSVDGYEKAQSGTYSSAAKVIRRRMSVGVSPDSPVNELRFNADNPGSMVFTDSLGNPWNVDDVIFPKALITVRKRGNVLLFEPAGGGDNSQPPRRFGRSSMTVMMEGTQTTIPFQISYGFSKEIDGQVEAQIQARNPLTIRTNSRSDLIEPDQVSELFLDGEPPKAAQELKTSARTLKAWLYNKRLYVRTQLAVESPAYQVYASSAVGMSVYRFDEVPSIINAIVDGAIVSVTIGE